MRGTKTRKHENTKKIRSSGFVISRFRGFVVLIGLCGASCAAPLVKLPSGPGAPAPDAAETLNAATTACRAVSTLSAEVGVSGSVGGRRLRGRLLVGVAPPASARIEAVAPAGQPIFIFVAAGDEATLLLPRDNRVLPHGSPAAVLEAVAGPPLDAVQLRETLTGCVSASAGTQGRQLGNDWRVVSIGQTDVYLHRATGNWQLAAAVHRGGTGEWRAEYGDFEAGSPRTIRLASADGKRFDLRLKLSQVETNAQLGADVFRVQIPRDADPITLDELRRSGPLGAPK
jgi:outer membrane lipoprotein-sorting protein